MRSEGICTFCKKTVAGSAMAKHIVSCKEREEKLSKESKETKDKVYLLRASAGPFFAYFEVNATDNLEDVDEFLRDLWLECCGHLSSFTIEDVHYDSQPLDDMMGESKHKTMGIQLRRVLRPGLTFSHEYDFGTTTELDLKVIAERAGNVKHIPLLARNNPPDVKCKCGKPVKEICAQCMWEDKGLLCGICAKKHECGEEMLLPAVNSPRAGMCGYTG